MNEATLARPSGRQHTQAGAGPERLRTGSEHRSTAAAAWVLRIGVAGTFLGHGLYAASARPSWVVYLTTVGFTPEAAVQVMPFIGVLDVGIAMLALFRPMRGVFLWAALWAFAAAAIRPLSGEPILEFVERASLWCAPLGYLLLVGFPAAFRTS